MEQTLLAAGTESIHHNTAWEAGEPWSAGEDPPLLPWPRTHWGMSLGMLYLWEAVGTGPGLLSHPRAQLHAGLPHSTTLLLGDSLPAENSSSALLPASVLWAVIRILWGSWSFLLNHLHTA